MPWSSFFAKCTWWCCRVVMGTTIQWTLNTKCLSIGQPGSQNLLDYIEMYMQVCASCFPTPVISPFSFLLSKEFQPWSFLIWKQCCPLNQLLCKTSHSTTMFPSDTGTKTARVTQKDGHTHSCSVWGPSWSPCRFCKAVSAAGHSQKLFWAGWLSVQWGAGMNR